MIMKMISDMMCCFWSLITSCFSPGQSELTDQPMAHRCLWHREQGATISLHSELEPLMTQLQWTPQAPRRGQRSYLFCNSRSEPVEVALPYPSFLDCPAATLEDFVSKLNAVHGIEKNAFSVWDYSQPAVHSRLTDWTEDISSETALTAARLTDDKVLPVRMFLPLSARYWDTTDEEYWSTSVSWGCDPRITPQEDSIITPDKPIDDDSTVGLESTLIFFSNETVTNHHQEYEDAGGHTGASELVASFCLAVGLPHECHSFHH